MVSKRNRRETGRVYNKNYNPKIGEYYTIHWDEWNYHRDGMRSYGEDKTKSKKSKKKSKLFKRIRKNIAELCRAANGAGLRT